MRKLAAVFFLISASAVLFLWPSRALADAIVSVASPASASQGSTFAIDVNIANVSDLYAFQLDLSFNPSVLQATSILEGAFLPGGGPTFFIPGAIDNTAGSVTFNADTLQGAIPGVNGSGTLIQFDFTAVGNGTSFLNLGNIILQDSSLGVISNSATNGSAMVAAVPEPSSLMLLIAGMLGWLILALKKTTP